MTVLETLAPAKVNWTLEVLGRRPDGYHEVRTVLQTIDLADTVRVRPADSLELRLSGRSEDLAGLPPESNLALRAASLLRSRTGRPVGARIEIEKRIPVGAGLGGGSSDAAAVLRALAELWGAAVPAPEMASLAAEVGSDVAFFLRGGTALATGRGEVITALPDVPTTELLLAVPPGSAAPDKTARMYGLLGREHYSDGSATDALVARLRAGHRPRARDLCNVFDGVAGDTLSRAGEALPAGRRRSARPHLTGAGQGLFILSTEAGSAGLADALSAAGFHVVEAATLAAAAATAVRSRGDAGAGRRPSSGGS